MHYLEKLPFLLGTTLYKIYTYIISNQIARDIFSYTIAISIYMPFAVWWFHSSVVSNAPSTATQKGMAVDLSHFVHTVTPKEKLPIHKIQTPAVNNPVKKEIKPIRQQEPKGLLPIKQIQKSQAKTTTKQESAKPNKRTKTKSESKDNAKASNKFANNLTKCRKKHPVSSIKNSIQNQTTLLSRLKQKIEANKRYPLIAKQKGIGGVVNILFSIDAGGNLVNLQLSGSKLFFGATREAVQAAFPVSPKESFLPLERVRLAVHYNIQNN